MRIAGRQVSKRIAVVAALPLLVATAIFGSLAVAGDLPFSSSSATEDCEPTPAAAAVSPATASTPADLTLSVSHEPATLPPIGTATWTLRVTNTTADTVSLHFAT